MDEIFIIHNDWRGICILSTLNKIIRKDFPDEIGYYNIIENKLIIKWEKWDEEEFYNGDNQNTYYLKKIYNELFITLYLFEYEKLKIINLNKNNNKFAIINEEINFKYGIYELNDDILIINKKKYYKYNDNFYWNKYSLDKLDLPDEYLFKLNIINEGVNENYIFNKISKKFFNINNIKNNGIYEIFDNNIYMKWSNGYKKTFYTNKYSSVNIKGNINIIKPKNIIINDSVLFGNISLCKNKIILSSIHYKIDTINPDDIIININDYKIKQKTVYDHDDYESSFTIILELEEYVNELVLNINYKKIFNYEIFLEQSNIIDHNISAMTLFKDDYDLLKQYINYYSNLGVDLFFLYYNGILTDDIVDKIININVNNNKIYLTEWNYIYWWKYGKNLKHHHAQTMAINDSLNILKNYSNYILYNDLDEYIVFDNKYNNFKELINNNIDISTFIFKNRFCKMGNELIKYKDFDIKFDLNNIIKGNYWDKAREKNIINAKNINVMGVHGIFHKYNDKNKNINEKVISEFYHIINFEEKYRENLMTEYIS